MDDSLMAQRFGRKRKPRSYAATSIIDQVAVRMKKGEAVICFRHGTRLLVVPSAGLGHRETAALMVSRAVASLKLSSAKGLEVIEPPATDTPVTLEPVAVPSWRSTTRCRRCGAFMQAGGVCGECE